MKRLIVIDERDTSIYKICDRLSTQYIEINDYSLCECLKSIFTSCSLYFQASMLHPVSALNRKRI